VATIHGVGYVLNITEDSPSAGDYPSSNLMYYSGETATSFFCCDGQPLPRAFNEVSLL